MNKKPNFKAEAEKVVARILATKSQAERHRIMGDYLYDTHDRGEAAAVRKAYPGMGQAEALILYRRRRIPSPPEPKAIIQEFLKDLGSLSKVTGALHKDLKGAL